MDSLNKKHYLNSQCVSLHLICISFTVLTCSLWTILSFLFLIIRWIGVSRLRLCSSPQKRISSRLNYKTPSMCIACGATEKLSTGWRVLHNWYVLILIVVTKLIFYDTNCYSQDRCLRNFTIWSVLTKENYCKAN